MGARGHSLSRPSADFGYYPVARLRAAPRPYAPMRETLAAQAQLATLDVERSNEFAYAVLWNIRQACKLDLCPTGFYGLRALRPVVRASIALLESRSFLVCYQSLGFEAFD